MHQWFSLNWMQPIYVYCCHEKVYRKNQKMKFNKFPINIGYYSYDDYDYKNCYIFCKLSCNNCCFKIWMFEWNSIKKIKETQIKNFSFIIDDFIN